MLISDLVIFYASTILLVKKLYASTSTPLLLVLLNPTLILIDHGHFQYNCVSLGLMQLAVYFIVSHASKQTANKACILLATGSACFSLALNYKQMELYHALPFFFYLLSICISNSKDSIPFRFIIIMIRSQAIVCFFNVMQKLYRVGKLACVGAAVILTFAVVWLPFLASGFDASMNVLSRLFPFARGLFEVNF